MKGILVVCDGPLIVNLVSRPGDTLTELGGAGQGADQHRGQQPLPQGDTVLGDIVLGDIVAGDIVSGSHREGGRLHRAPGKYNSTALNAESQRLSLLAPTLRFQVRC